MLSLFAPKAFRLMIDGGRVRCPVRESDVEVDHCADCPWLVNWDDKALHPSVVCRPGIGPISRLRGKLF